MALAFLKALLRRPKSFCRRALALRKAPRRQQFKALALVLFLLVLVLLPMFCGPTVILNSLWAEVSEEYEPSDEEHPVIQRLLLLQQNDYRSPHKPLFCNESNSNRRPINLEAIQKSAIGRSPRDCVAARASSHLQCPEYGGAHLVLASNGMTIDQFRERAMKALEEPNGAERLRATAPCCALDQTYSFFAPVTPAFSNQTYYYDVHRTLLEPNRTLAECSREAVESEFLSAPYLMYDDFHIIGDPYVPQRIRETWVRDYREQMGRGGRRVVHVFVLARGEGEEQRRVELEAAAFGDLLQKDVPDSYFSHTRKVLALYEWLARRCERARWLLKGDDDVFINMKRLERDLRELEGEQDNRALYSTSGFIESRTSIQRDKSYKQFLSDEVFPFKFLEIDYVYGFAALTPLRLVRDVLAISVCVRGVFLDDTFVNGYLPHLLGARVRLWQSLNWRILWNRPKRLSWDYIAGHAVTPELTAAEVYTAFLERQLPASADAI